MLAMEISYHEGVVTTDDGGTVCDRQAARKTNKASLKWHHLHKY